ncbi:MAG: hypothetical protein ACI9U5_001326 [Colwellia sp.]|jgi:hypothetical protein
MTRLFEKLSIPGPTMSKVDNEKSLKKLILFLLDKQNVYLSVELNFFITMRYN